MTASAPEGRLARFFGLDDPWVRPRPPLEPADWRLALTFLAFGALGLELIGSFADWSEFAREPWLRYLALVTGTLPLAFRRRYPLVVSAYAMGHFVFTGTQVPEIGYQLAMQLGYFFSIYSGVAWARNRRAMAIVMLGVVLLLFGWLAWDFAYGSAVSELLGDDVNLAQHGILPPLPAFVVWSALLNGVYLFGAILLGQANWRQARDRALRAEQAVTIADQASALRDQAVVDERLRIARELHDVVAHHVSVMGVQAAGARRVLTRDPDAAAAALAHVENSSREAVREMRGLLGTLRGAGLERPDPGADQRAPEPGASEIEALVASFAEPGFAPAFTLVEDAPGALAGVHAPIGLSLYRTVQEALTNVRRHSTAGAASVALRVGRDPGGPRFAEAEVLDDGRPRAGTSGTGLGQLGMRERIASHGGTAEIGPRLTGGYRVRVRFPLKEES